MLARDQVYTKQGRATPTRGWSRCTASGGQPNIPCYEPVQPSPRMPVAGGIYAILTACWMLQQSLYVEQIFMNHLDLQYVRKRLTSVPSLVPFRPSARAVRIIRMYSGFICIYLLVHTHLSGFAVPPTAVTVVDRRSKTTESPANPLPLNAPDLRIGKDLYTTPHSAPHGAESKYIGSDVRGSVFNLIVDLFALHKRLERGRNHNIQV